MPDSGKLNPAMVIVPLGAEEDGDPPPDDPQALTIMLSPRIVDSRALTAHLGIANSSWSRAGLGGPRSLSTRARTGMRPWPVVTPNVLEPLVQTSVRQKLIRRRSRTARRRRGRWHAAPAAVRGPPPSA